jgi:dTDP-4-dehydrorhamnose reductase
VERILVAGIDTVVGSNIAATLSQEYNVVGLSFSAPISIEGCETSVCARQDQESIRKWIGSVRPQVTVHCPISDCTGWQKAKPSRPPNDVEPFFAWARAAQEVDSQFTLVSTDAVFSGPWMFHKEESRCHCESGEARAIRAAESAAREAHPRTLLVRTCAYGWRPESSGLGTIEDTVAKLEEHAAGPFDSQHYATPILASDLAEILHRAWEAQLAGVYHIGGAERVSPLRFAERLAERFGLPAPTPVRAVALVERPKGFAQGETSLHATKIRKALGVAVPMLDEGLARLYEQTGDGYCDRLSARVSVLHGRVA